MERRAITIEGVVQGVGFRPFVYGLAARHRLCGFVKNEAGSVRIEVEGDAPSLDRFLGELQKTPPALSQIENVSWRVQRFSGEPVAFASRRVTPISPMRFSSRPTLPPATIACSGVVRPGRSPLLGIRSSTARAAVRASPSSPGRRTTANARRWRRSRCARPAAPSTTTRGTAAFTRNRSRVPIAARGCPC